MATEKYAFERYLNVHAFHGPGFSPDGTTLSFLANITGVDEVWSVPLAMEAQRPYWPAQLTFRGERFSGAEFSPRTDILLVSGDVGGNERTQFYILSADGSTFKPLTERPEIMHLFGGWSPDGTKISYSSNERDQRYFDVYERNVTSGEVKLLFQQDGANYAREYAPDGNSVLIAHTESNARNQLLLVDVHTGVVTALTAETEIGPSSYGTTGWAVTGQAFYVLSNYQRQFRSLAYIDVTTKRLTYLTDTSWDTEKLAITLDGKYLALVTNEDGYSRLELFEVLDGWDQRQSLPVPTLPKGVIEEIKWSPDGTKLAITFNCADDSLAIWVWNVQTNIFWRATPSTLAGIPQSAFVSPSVVRYPTFDGREIPAFLYLPHDNQKQLPIIVYVHGGPEGQSLPTFNGVIQYFVNHGYGVLAPNVRGSTGYGYAYQSLDDIRLRMDSVADLQYAAIWLKESGIADPERIAVMGGSYGGFMVLAAVTSYPDLWSAGIDIVGIANFVTFLENTGPWRRKIREVEYGSLENDREFLEQISPIRSVDRIIAPMCIIHGANDPRVPVGEAEQIVEALRAREVPVEYLRFEDEGHGIVKRANRLIAYPAIARFLEKYAGETTASSAVPPA